MGRPPPLPLRPGSWGLLVAGVAKALHQGPTAPPWTQKPEGGLTGAMSCSLLMALEPQWVTWSQASL